MVGKIVPNYESFPGAQTRKTMQLNVGTYLNDAAVHSNQYYNLPHVGVGLGFSDLGNNENLGQEISLVPFISLNASNKLKNSWHFKFGLGGSYFTKKYEEETNPFNKAIGSSLNWTFQAFVYHQLLVSEHFNMRIGGGFWHSSNSHTQLPNFGLNSAMLSLSFNYYLTEIDPDFRKEKHPEKTPKQPFIQTRVGLGMHEFGSTIGPVGGPKKPVYTIDFDYGYLFNHQLKAYAGLFYRFYQSFYDYSKENPTNSSPAKQASNINFHLGIEYLLGHVGMNVEGGINLYKPFYDEYYDLYENGDPFNEFRMALFSTRLGMNLYLKNTNKNPKNNLALGAHINANFGKADFGEVGLMYMRVLASKN